MTLIILLGTSPTSLVLRTAARHRAIRHLFDITTIYSVLQLGEGSVAVRVCKCIYRNREIFALKIIRIKNFRAIKFSLFRSIREIFLTVDDCSTDERLESSWRLVYYQVSGEPGIAYCSRRSDIYLRECGLARASLFTDHRRVILFFAC